MLTVESVHQTTVVHFDWPGVLDEIEIERIGQQLLHLIDTLGQTRIVLDLSTARRVSSRLVSVLAEAHQRLEAAGGRLVMWGLMPDLAKVLRLTGLDRMLHVYDSELEAIESFPLEAVTV